MPARLETPSPPLYLIAADRQTQRRGIHAWRPRGTKDWLLTLTLAGAALYHFPGGHYRTRPGDLVLVPPGVPHDYGVDSSTGFWTNIWAHFLPRPDQLEWLHWPEIGRGHLALWLPPALRRVVARHLTEAVRQAHVLKPLSQQRAMNAFDRALLECADFSPRSRQANHDPRIARILDFIHDRFAADPPLAELAARAGLSRTRFTEQFQRQVGEPPCRYVEKLRLNHARQLWEYGRLTLGEIAGRLNYSSPYYLSLRFKREFGLSPKHYREKLLAAGRGN